MRHTFKELQAARVLRRRTEEQWLTRVAEVATLIDTEIARKYGDPAAEVTDDEWVGFHALGVRLMELRDVLEDKFGDAATRALFKLLAKGQKGRPRGALNKTYSPGKDAERQRRRRQRHMDELKGLIDLARRKPAPDDPIK